MIRTIGINARGYLWFIRIHPQTLNITCQAAAAWDIDSFGQLSMSESLVKYLKHEHPPVSVTRSECDENDCSNTVEYQVRRYSSPIFWQELKGMSKKIRM